MRELTRYIDRIEHGLERYLKAEDCPQKIVYEAMKYSVDAGGKRLRPVLCLAACEAFGGKAEEAVAFACAIEMIHTYSLIHDDLPCMDDDDMRRGRPTNHKVFGEATAVLAGDALLTYAFEVAASCGLPAKQRAEAVRQMARWSGPDGMIGGQIVDMLAEEQEITEEQLYFLHEHKTSALICESLLLGLIAADADETAKQAMTEYGRYFGLAFQIRDDMLDVIGESAELGKPIGSDSENTKTTFVTMFGLERSAELVQEYTEKAVKAVRHACASPDFFINFANDLVNRKK